MKKILLFVLSFVMSSFSALAAEGVPTASEMFKNLFSDLSIFAKGVMVGSASMDNTYFLVFIAYFILILAIYVEGLKFLPLFGGKGDISTPGKWFAFAATTLSVMGIFVAEQASGQSSQELINMALAPFGVWAGLALAGIFALIVFLAGKDSGLFEKHMTLGITYSLAVGMIFAGFFLSQANVIGWGYFLMIIAIIVGIIVVIVKHYQDSPDTGDSFFGKAKYMLGGGKPSEPSTPSDPEKPSPGGSKNLARKLARALRNVWRYNTRATRNIKAANSALKNKGVAEAKKKIATARRYEKKEMDFDRYVTEAVGELEKISVDHPDTKTKLEVMKRSLEKDLKINLKDKLETAAKTSGKAEIKKLLDEALEIAKRIDNEVAALEALDKKVIEQLINR